MTHCTELEPYALQVLGDGMLPEFPPGVVVVVEPTHSAPDGAYVVADTGAGVVLGRWRCDGERRWLEGAGGPLPLAEGDALRVLGIVVERAAGPGIRRKRYPAGPAPAPATADRSHDGP